MLRFRRMHSLQKFASIHASFHNLFNSQRLLSKRSTFKLNRDAALTEWPSVVIQQNILINEFWMPVLAQAKSNRVLNFLTAPIRPLR